MEVGNPFLEVLLMRLFLATCVVSVLACIGLPVSASADPFGCDSVPVNIFQVESAAACGGGTGLIAMISHSDEWGFLHWDCFYYSDWPYPHSWMVHGC